MRLFIAVNFTDEIKDKLADCIRRLSRMIESANFTRVKNLHLTLVFLGEVPEARLGAVKRAMERAVSEDFEVRIGGLGRFRRRGGDIIYLGVEKNRALSVLHDSLRAELVKEGFIVEAREYKPHLTLGREAVVGGGFNYADFRVPEMCMRVGEISLMRSDRINGILAYTEIFSKKLEAKT